MAANSNGAPSLVLVNDDPDVARAVASLVAVLPPSARGLSLERLAAIHRRAA
jgi:hypothetical protein